MGLDTPTVAKNLTPLHLAAIVDDEWAAKTLIGQNKVDVNARDSLSRTPLWYAIGHAWGRVLVRVRVTFIIY